MSVLEQIAGVTRTEAEQYEWPSRDNIDSYSWHPAVQTRGSVRLFAGLVVGEDETARNLERSMHRLREVLKR